MNNFINKKVAILTFHNTPNYGATLQCYALFNYLKSRGMAVEVINYMPVHTLVQYCKSLFLGKRRAVGNISRVSKFYSFVKKELKMSGPPIFSSNKLSVINEKKYDAVFVGSDEVWKVDHMRSFDPSFYFSFIDTARTKLIAYAATASTVTDLRIYAESVTPLLKRFSAIGVRDQSTFGMVEDLLGEAPTRVLDPTLIWDFDGMRLERMVDSPYVAVYSWLSAQHMSTVKRFAQENGLRVVCVGCRHKDADENFINIGPEEWLRLIKHASFVITDFFHGVLFSVIFKRPFYAHVDEKKRMKLVQALDWVGLPHHLFKDTSGLAGLTVADLSPDWQAVGAKLEPLRASSRQFILDQFAD